MDKKIVKLDNAFEKKYKIRKSTTVSNNYEITVPKLVLEREARKRGLTIDEFISRFRAKCHFNSFRGIYIDFVEVENE